MCIVEDKPNDPHNPHDPNVEPGRDAHASIDTLIRQLKYFWFLLIPIAAWVARVEGFVQEGDRQTAAMSNQQHLEMIQDFNDEIKKLPPQLYRDYVDTQFVALNARLDHIERLIEAQENR